MAARGAGADLLVVDDVHMQLARRPVLTGATLTAAPGTVTCLAGGNGAGKTTLLRLAAGIFIPERGSVRAGGFDPVRDRKAFAAQVGFVTAGNDGIYARLEVRQNLAMWAAIAYLPKAERRATIDDAMRLFGLYEYAERRTDRLSLGQRQRIRLALGTLHRPSVLLLDEPHTSLDDEGLALLSGAMERQRERGGAVVWAAPAPHHADALPRDVVVTIRDGRTDVLA